MSQSTIKKISKWGNSAAIRLPHQTLQEAGLHLGDSIEVEVVKDGILIKKKKRSIADMSIDEIISATSQKDVELSRFVNHNQMTPQPTEMT